MMVFDLGELRKQTGLSLAQLAQLEEKVRQEFGDDDVLFELHLLRVLTAIRDGRVSLEEALAEGVRSRRSRGLGVRA